MNKSYKTISVRAETFQKFISLCENEKRSQIEQFEIILANYQIKGVAHN